MIDMEKVIKGLELCIMDMNRSDPMPCRSCPYGSLPKRENCQKRLFADALSLLKGQEAVEPEWYDGTPFCGNCGHRLEKKNRGMKEIKCPTCDKAVKWNA